MENFTKGFFFSFLAIVLFGEWLAIRFVEGITVEEDLALTKAEKDALDKFKVRMIPKLPHDYMKHDIYLIRWLRARNLNLEQAEGMLTENLRWRKANNMDTISDEDWSDMADDYNFSLDAEDKLRRPLGSANIGLWSHRRAVLTGKGQRFLRYHDKLFEEATQLVIKKQRQGQNVTQWKVIFNMDGFNLIQNACPVCLPIYTAFVTSYEEHYPGYADRIILINTPPVFQVVLDLIQPIFSASTRKALKIFGTNKKQWMDYIDKEISPEQRRVEFGGTRKD